MSKTYEMRKIADIQPSSVGNVRKNIGDLKELTGNIKRVGVLQPVTVRVVDGSVEIIFGHRRLAAAKLAKLTEIPVIFRDIDDSKVVELQLAENIQREDIHALDEAQGYQALREQFDYSVEKVMETSGKAKAYIYAALKLVELSPESQALFRKGDFDTSVAVYIARLPADAQVEACAVVSRADRDGDMPSARVAFKLVEAVGKRADLNAAWLKSAAAHEKGGGEVVEAKEAKKLFNDYGQFTATGYVQLAEKDFNHSKAYTYGEIVAKDLPPVIFIQNPHTRETMRLCTQKEFKASVERIYKGKGYLPNKDKMSPADRKQHEAVIRDRKFRAVAMPLVVEKAVSGPSVNLLRALLALAVERVSWGTFSNSLLKPYDRKPELFKAGIASLNEKELRDELVALLLQGSSHSEFLNVCKLLKVPASALTKAKDALAAQAKAAEARAKERAKKAAAKEKAAAKKAIKVEPKRALKKAKKGKS